MNNSPFKYLPGTQVWNMIFKENIRVFVGPFEVVSYINSDHNFYYHTKDSTGAKQILMSHLVWNLEDLQSTPFEEPRLQKQIAQIVKDQALPDFKFSKWQTAYYWEQSQGLTFGAVEEVTIEDYDGERTSPAYQVRSLDRGLLMAHSQKDLWTKAEIVEHFQRIFDVKI